MSLYVPETAIDYDAVFRRGGANLGDEDFAVFKCASCGLVYLIDYEVETVFLDGADLSKRVGLEGAPPTFVCVGCKQPVPSGVWIGPRAEERFKVTWHDLACSAFSWIAAPSKSFGDQL